MSLVIRIDGEPIGQRRPQFSRFSWGRPLAVPRAIDPAQCRAWKERARGIYLHAVRASGLARPTFPSGPLEVSILAVFACLERDVRVRVPAARRWKDTKPDPDNVIKICLDPGNGILWKDDGQVARVSIDRWFGAQDEDPFLELTVRAL